MEQCTTCDARAESQDDPIFDDCKKKHHEIIEMLDLEVVSKDGKKTKSPKSRKKISFSKKIKKKVKGWVGDYNVESVIIDRKPFFLALNKNTLQIELHESIEDGDYSVKPLESQE